MGGFILPYLIALFVLYIILKLLALPFKIIVKLLINALVGAAIIYLINIFGATIGFSIAITWVTAIIVGILGVPGVLIVVLLQLFL